MRTAARSLARALPCALLSLLAACSRRSAPVEGSAVAPKAREAPVAARPSRGCTPAVPLGTPGLDLGIRVLTADTIVVISDPTPFLRARIAANCAVGDPSRPPGDPRDYRHVFALRYAAKEMSANDRPRILSALSDSAHFSIQGEGVEAHPTRQGVWPQALRELRLPTAAETPDSVVTDTAEIAYFSYLRLAGRLKRGATYTVTDRWGNRASFTYDANTTSWALKVDQVGHLPDAPKIAYLGSWLGPSGPLDASAFAGRPFEVVRGDGTSAFTGTVRKRSDEQMSQGQPLYGETVYELDFSPLREPGVFRVAVEGVGVSFPFRIGQDAMGEAFYTHARGLYHARCGPLSKETTAWARGDGHTTVRRGAFPPEDDDYKDHSADGWGFSDENGAYAAHTSFEMVKLTATDVVAGDLAGGWHDAGDFDRRPQNLSIVADLAHAYLFFPENFSDGQLDLPESGNGIPDVLDEAAFGLRPLFRAQAADGRVSTWIESTRHPEPGASDPATDTKPYYLSLATRNGSLQYSAAAALYARALKTAGREADAARYTLSAARAYAFGTDPSQRASTTFVSTNGKTHRWIEPPHPDPARRLYAALELSLTTGDRRYLDDLVALETTFAKEIGDSAWRQTSFSMVDVALADAGVPAGWSARARAALTSIADKALAAQANDAYRKVWYEPTHPYFRHIGWGSAEYIPIRVLVAAWRVTGDERYRAGALLGVDWMQGANPQGRVSTTGLGTNFPVALLHLPSMVDGWDEPVPGITIYGYSANLPYSARARVYGMYDDARVDQRFIGLAIPQLPPPWDAPTTTREKVGEVLTANVPIWRRMTLLENQNPPMTEFTVHETIGPAAAITGSLLGPGWMPSARLRGRKPRTIGEMRDAYWYQP